MWPIMNPLNGHIERMQHELRDLREECELLRRENANLKRQVNFFLRNETWLKATFKKLRSETAQSNRSISSSDNTAGASVNRNMQASVYRQVISYLHGLSYDNLRLSENLRRERELLAQSEKEATASAAHYQEVTSELMTKLNSLQTRGETLHDDQCASEWRKLQQALDVWTRRTFMDKSALSRMTAIDLQQRSPFLIVSEDMFQNVQGKRAFIQSIISREIFESFLNQCFALCASSRSDRILRMISHNVRKSGSSYTWETWRTATSKALDDRADFSSHRLDDACNKLSQMIETLFSPYYSPNIHQGYIHEAIHQIFNHCLVFKKALERQEFEYVFRQSPRETVYSAAKMHSLNYNEDEGSTVMMSIWPSIYKVSFENEELLIESEAVWTKQPTHINESGTEDRYDIEKQIKQEVKSEEDDDELSLIMFNPGS